MSSRPRTLTREFGTALAVLAVYVLTLLAPLHQAAGLQRDLAALGYETQGSWSVCAPLVDDGDGSPRALVQVKCPASGVGKNELLAVLPAAIVIAPRLDTAVVLAFMDAPHLASGPENRAGRSRAPPVLA
ncbi:hypothetical protein DEVEQU_01486 [Devosia equisanguinis]|uniref:Uncharacterized protein n=1 Tax=Devosia equisanguinis TaxID=2490941 RepID=A0A3S5D3C4_9HYPH|nr:hypothetical protein [Devosia equisanguinis]VDS04351.1 hypothetical protein DEVEQU_01486 [Devosia equisanguinis]